MKDRKTVKVNLGLSIDCEINTDSNFYRNKFERSIYDAVRGKGDVRKGINMNADIGYYVATKIQENLDSEGLGNFCKITGHTIHISEDKK